MLIFIESWFRLGINFILVFWEFLGIFYLEFFRSILLIYFKYRLCMSKRIMIIYILYLCCFIFLKRHLFLFCVYLYDRDDKRFEDIFRKRC